MRAQGQARIVVVMIVAALTAVVSGPSAEAESRPRSSVAPPISVDSPTYLPAGLPGGFGAHPVRFTGRRGGYSLTARAHDTTYRIRVATKQHGTTTLEPTKLATFEERIRVAPGERVQWSDQVADVTISATGPPGHTRDGMQRIGTRMVVVPHSVLAQLVGATKAPRPRHVNLEPVRFEGTTIRQSMYGHLGRAAISFTTPGLSTGMNVCATCTPGAVSVIGGWRGDGRTLMLIGVPRATVVQPSRGVHVERQLDSGFGSELVLLRTERSDHPSVVFTGPAGLHVRIPMAEIKL